MTTPTAVDIDALPPVQYLVLDVLAARWRTGETLWTFPSRLRTQIAALAKLGLVHEMHGSEPKTIRARLTEAGIAATTDPNYRPPIPFPDHVRVVVVLNHARVSQRFGMTTVHGITCDDAEAQRWVQDLTDKHGGPLAATMTVGLVYPNATPKQEMMPS